MNHARRPMPNTLAHLGVQALITRQLIPRADFGWIWLGCLLPDLPWIMQRIVKALPVDIDPIDLRLYSVVQSSLLLCLIAAAGFAALGTRPGRVFAILALGSLMHLLLDATQTKWANGVLLFAPLDWRLVNFGLFWPEDWPSHALSLFGLGFFALAALRLDAARPRPPRFLAPRFFAPRAGIAVFGLLLFVWLPMPLMPMAKAADVHYAATLSDPSARPNREVDFDRADILRDGTGAPLLLIWTGETLRLSGQPIPPSAETVSLRGRFADFGTLEVNAFHLHPSGQRDAST